MEGSNIADPELRRWYSTASPADREDALQVGWRNVGHMRSVRKASSVQSTVVVGQPTINSSELPVQRGQIGEDLVETILRERFSDITNMTKVPKSGDITLWIGGRKTIIEVKNYTNPVPTSGVEKFRRDLSTAGADSGVFISLQSSISSITSDFKIQLEVVDGRTVPCVYIVSSNREQIITSISMCIHLSSSLLGVSRELYSRDQLLGIVRSLATHIDELAGTRHNMQRELADASERAIKNSSCIMSTEVKLRMDVEKLQSELCEAIVHGGDMSTICKSITGYEKLSPETKTNINSVIMIIQEQPGPDIIATWKVTAKKCINQQSGCAINFSAKRVYVSIPVGRIGVDLVSQLIFKLGKKYEWSDQTHNIDITGETIKIISDLIKGTFVGGPQ
jgi:hypothetical protein